MKHEKVLIMLCVLLAFMCSVTLSNLFRIHVDAQETQVITTTQVNLVDTNGRLRGVLSGEDEYGMASIAFYDDQGQVRNTFGIDNSGSPVLRLNNQDGIDRLSARVVGEDARLIVGDDKRQGQFALVSGMPVLSLAEGGINRAGIQMGQEGETSLVLFGSEGHRSVVLSVDSNDTPLVTLYEEGRQRLSFGVVSESAVLNASDGSRTRLVMGVAQNGRPSINFLNENGEVIHELP